MSHDHDILIVGSGFSGLGMAIRLKQAGMHDFAVLERADEVGGTWQANTYPGCACDVPSHLYSFSFAPNPEWTQTYSPQPEIWEYLRRCADDFGVRPHVRLGCAVESATWLEAERRWELETTQGTYRARILIAGMGPLTEPRIPEIPGLDGFEGEVWHSARWNHDYDLAGKRVASIGTGASAIQYVPEIAKQVARLHVFQRTAPWVMPHSNRPITDAERRVYRAVPALQKLVRGGIYGARELLVFGFVVRPRLMRLIERIARRHIRSQIDDPRLLEQVTPGYTIGCKRILPSNRWYRALNRPNVDLITSGVQAVRPRSIVDGDGAEHAVDAIVFGTGFHVTDIPAAQRVRGRGGTLLDDVWHGSPRAYFGSTIAGFPNLFFLLGPNTGLGHSSMVYMIESQIAHVMAALRHMDARGAETIEVRPEAQERHNAEIDRRMKGTVWTTGCSSWYLDDTGRNATLWPDWTWRFRRLAAQLRTDDYALDAPVREPALV
ncbi:MAG TPA: NAD(P)/FAD-dependent oxidoreductase [Solirubrobacteraceae bacterium]|nr:NAD(P)/FAD-dependent oxidoreductase [Solirubrobacteraceae bacterium]